MRPETINGLARNFFDAFHTKSYSADLSFPITGISLEEAYAVQEAVSELRIESGDAVAGYKVGCTSPAIRAQLGLSEPIVGRLFERHVHSALQTKEVFYGDFVNCAIEPELVLRIRKDIEGENLSESELINSIEYVSAGLELHHFHFWFGSPSSQELICSNGIHAGLIVGEERVSPAALTFRNESFEVWRNGSLVTRAVAAKIMRGPLHSLRWLIRHLTQKQQRLKAGSLVIPGSPGELIRINSDTEVAVIIERVGQLTTRFRARPTA
ncbi:MAG: hypothetical protein O2960_15000 [Verrucomicrobia bacterium]|nr:hypothetical protein [Verrucomicrobiota bacterium]